MPQIMYVVSHQHYQFEPTEEDRKLVAILAVTDNLTNARVYADKLAEIHAGDLRGEVQENKLNALTHLFWVKSNNRSCTPSVWVVQGVEVI